MKKGRKKGRKEEKRKEKRKKENGKRGKRLRGWRDIKMVEGIKGGKLS